MRRALKKISTFELELLELKATLLPKLKASKEEIKEIEEAERDIANGLGINAETLIKTLGER